MTVRLTKDEVLFLDMFLSGVKNDMGKKKDELGVEVESCQKQMKKENADSESMQTRIKALEEQTDKLDDVTGFIGSVCRKLTDAQNQGKSKQMERILQQPRPLAVCCDAQRHLEPAAYAAGRVRGATPASARFHEV